MLHIGIYNKNKLSEEYASDITTSLNEALGLGVKNLIIKEKAGLAPISSATSERALIIRGNLLVNNGADTLVIPHNNVNIHAKAIAEATGKSVITPAESIAQGAEELFIKRVGLIATKAIMNSPVIKDVLEAKGIEVVVPSEVEQDLIDDIIRKILITADEAHYESAKGILIGIMEDLKDNGVAGYVLGCTELPKLLNQSDFDLPLLESTDLHKKAILKRVVDSISTSDAKDLKADQDALALVKRSPYQIYY